MKCTQFTVCLMILVEKIKRIFVEVFKEIVPADLFETFVIIAVIREMNSQ